MTTMFLDDPGKTGGRRRLVLAAAVLGFAGALTLGGPEALAGACEYTKRTNAGSSPIEGKGVSAHTVVRNKASTGTFDATISRGSSEKSSGTLSLGQQISKLSNVAAQGDFEISVTRSGGNAARTCTYTVYLLTGIGGAESYTEWSLGGCSNSAGGIDFKISCSKSYHSGKQRWNTNFVIEDPDT